MSVVAVFGGSFNPPHVGHAMVMNWILQTGLADRFLMVPSCAHPFGKNMFPFGQRVEWCKDMVKDMCLTDKIEVCEIEAKLPQPNFTINLLRCLADLHPQDTLRFVMGTDILNDRHRWHGFDDIVESFSPILANRVGAGPSQDTSPVFPNISSTEIRNRLANGLPVNHLLTKTVNVKVTAYVSK